MRWLVRLAAPAIALILSTVQVSAAPPTYVPQGTVMFPQTTAQLIAVDPIAHIAPHPVIPLRPFVYSVDKTGLTITRLGDNAIVSMYGPGRVLTPTDPAAGPPLSYLPWPEVLWVSLPDGNIMPINAPLDGWEPVAMVVSAPTDAEIANRLGGNPPKPIPDLTPPFTFVYVVMAHSGYEWKSALEVPFGRDPNVRDSIVPSLNPDTESALLVQVDVSDPSFGASRDPYLPIFPHVAGAFLGHGAGQPVFDRKTGAVYVGNEPSSSLPVGLDSFISVIPRIDSTVTEPEREVPGIGIPVIRCGPQHPETGIPVGKVQAFACYDPSGMHRINDNEHSGAFGRVKEWDAEHGGDTGGEVGAAAVNPFQEQYVWEFRNLPDWLTPHVNKVTGQLDGILYGTPPTTGEWFAEARVHDLGDDFGIFSAWTPVRLLVTPSAAYLPIKAQFAVGEPAAWPLSGTGDCTVVGAPAWIDVQAVPGGCVVMGRAPISGEHYEFTLPNFREDGYPDKLIVFSGDVVGPYGFDPLPEGVTISGLAYHQVSKAADPSTETPVLTLELFGVEPSTGQLYQIAQPPGRPQPPNERPAETAIGIDVISPFGEPLGATLAGARFGEVAVEADRDIFVAAITEGSDGAVMKVSGDTVTTINLPGVQPFSLALDSDLRTAVPGVEPGQVDNGALWVAGTGLAVVDTALGEVAQVLSVPDLGLEPLSLAVSVHPGTRYAYVGGGSPQQVTIFGPPGDFPPIPPRIWSVEEVTFNLAPAWGSKGEFFVMATGYPLPTLTYVGGLPEGVTFEDLGNGFARVSGVATSGWDFPAAIVATNAVGTYAQAAGVAVQGPPSITNAEFEATFYVGVPSSFEVTGTSPGEGMIIYTYAGETPDPAEGVMPPGVMLIDNENGTASITGTPTQAGTYTFKVHATAGCPPDAERMFTLTVLESAPGEGVAPRFTSPDSAVWEAVGAPFAPDPFTVNTIGVPTPKLSITGQLPPGVNFVDNGDSTGVLGGGCVMTYAGPSCLGALFGGTAGIYQFTITATNDAGTTTQPFTLELATATSIMNALPATLAFEYTAGGTAPAAQSVVVGTLGDTFPIAPTTTAPWLKATPFGIAPGPIDVSVDVAGLAAGTYSGTVIVQSAGTDGPFATIGVSLTVSDVPLMRATPGMLTFESRTGDAAPPPAQTVALTSGGLPIGFTAKTSASWLVATPATGMTPGNLRVSVDASKVGVGTHMGTVTIGSTGANGPQKISVLLFKNATNAIEFTPDIRVSYSVGSGPEGLAVNRNTHHVFIGTGNGAATEGGSEASEAVAAPPTADPAEGNAVYHLDPSKGTLIAGVLVHGEGEYVAVNSTTGRVYFASQGSYDIAVIDGNTDKVVTFIPMAFPEGAYMPYQIAIDEAQNIIYVGGHAPPIVDPILAPGEKKFSCPAIHEMPDDEYDCWNPGKVFVIDGETNEIVAHFDAGDDPEGVVFAAATGKVYASNEDDGSITVAKGAVRKDDGTVTTPEVIATIIRGVPVAGWWHPTCDDNNYCGERGQAALWPQLSVCNGIDDEAEEADKMTVDPHGNVYVIDDRYRVAKIGAGSDKVEKVLAIEGFQCEEEVPDGSLVEFRNTANNIAFSAVDNGVAKNNANGKGWRLYVTSEQDTLSVIDPVSMTLKQTIRIPGAGELDAIATDPLLDRVLITDEELSVLWILDGKKK